MVIREIGSIEAKMLEYMETSSLEVLEIFRAVKSRPCEQWVTIPESENLDYLLLRYQA